MVNGCQIGQTDSNTHTRIRPLGPCPPKSQVLTAKGQPQAKSQPLQTKYRLTTNSILIID